MYGEFENSVARPVEREEQFEMDYRFFFSDPEWPRRMEGSLPEDHVEMAKWLLEHRRVRLLLDHRELFEIEDVALMEIAIEMDSGDFSRLLMNEGFVMNIGSVALVARMMEAQFYDHVQWFLNSPFLEGEKLSQGLLFQMLDAEIRVDVEKFEYDPTELAKYLAGKGNYTYVNWGEEVRAEVDFVDLGRELIRLNRLSQMMHQAGYNQLFLEDELRGEVREAMLRHVPNDGEFHVFGEYEDAYDDGNTQAFAEEMVAVGNEATMVRILNGFRGLDWDFGKQVLAMDGGPEAVGQALKVEGVFAKKADEDVAIALLEGDEGCLPADGNGVIDFEIYFERFGPRFASACIDAGDPETLVDALGISRGLSANMFRRLVEVEGIDVLLNKKSVMAFDFEGEAVSVIEMLVQWRASTGEIERVLDRHTFSLEETKRLVEIFCEERDLYALAYLLDARLAETLDADLRFSGEAFGMQLDKRVYDLVRRFRAGELSEQDVFELTQFGIAHPERGEGVEFVRAARQFKEEVFSFEGVDTGRLLHSDLRMKVFLHEIRFSSAEFGQDVEPKYLIEKYQELRDAGRLKELDPAFESSEVVNIDKLDRDALAAFQFTDGGLNRFEDFRGALGRAFAMIDSDQAASGVVNMIGYKRDQLVQELRVKVLEMDNERAVAAMQKRIDVLEGMDFEDMSDWREMFLTLSSFRGVFDEELRIGVLWWGLQQLSDDRLEVARELVQRTSVRSRVMGKEFSWMANFVGHLMRKEVLAETFTEVDERGKRTKRGKKVSRALGGLLSVKGLDQEVGRLRDVGTRGTMEMQLVPQRNIMTEFSGHIGDACWAGKEDSMLERYPNVTSVTMVMNPESEKHRRLAGSMMLLEVTADDGTDLLVMRGVNPLENVINQLSPRAFVQVLREYLEPIAEKMGRKLGMVIDKKSGDAATNRPTLFGYLKDELKGELVQMKVSDEAATFNGYDIRNDVYVFGD